MAWLRSGEMMSSCALAEKIRLQLLTLRIYGVWPWRWRHPQLWRLYVDRTLQHAVSLSELMEPWSYRPSDLAYRSLLQIPLYRAIGSGPIKPRSQSRHRFRQLPDAPGVRRASAMHPSGVASVRDAVQRPSVSVTVVPEAEPCVRGRGV